jgi:hypothetical protein
MAFKLDMSVQDAFNQIVRGLAAQSWRPSISRSGTCAYRGANGRACAVGHLLPDEVANRLDEDLPGHGISIGNAARRHLINVPESMLDFLQDAQVAHDDAYANGSCMYGNFLALAERHDLQWPEDVCA